MANVRLQGITKIYDKKKVIDNVSLEINDKEFLVLVGSSGCGKSTILRMIAGLEDITEGEIFIGDNCVNNIHPKDRDIAFVFQSYALYPHMSVYDNIAFPLKMRKLSKTQIKEKVEKVAEALDLGELLERKPKQLSGGQRQRVALGRAIVREPKVFLMDEPLSNLDAKLRVHMRAEIKKLHKKLQTTFIYVTHDQTEALTMGDRIAVIDKGVIQQVDTPENIYNHPTNTFVGSFLGSPSMNLIKSNIIDGCIELNGNKIELTSSQKEILQGKKEVIIGIRPESINPIDANFDFTVEIEISEMLGSERIIYFSVNNAKCSAKIPSSFGENSENIRLSLNSNNLLFFDVESKKALS